jgi:hypothetical protein
MFLMFNRHFGRRHLVRAALGCCDGGCPFVSFVALLTWRDLLFCAKHLLSAARGPTANLKQHFQAVTVSSAEADAAVPEIDGGLRPGVR